VETNPEERHICSSYCVHFRPDDSGKYDGYCELLEKVIILELEEKCSSFGEDKTLKLW
jgi:hypothetical protein